MKALVYTGPHEMEFRDHPDPQPGPGEVVVEVEAVGICGSDMHAWHGADPRRRPPLVLGHEAAGRIVAGAGAGRRVTINPLIPCGDCRHCRAGREHLCPSRVLVSMNPRDGAFAERLAIPARNAVEIPEEADARLAALAEPMAVCWHAAKLGARAIHDDLAQARCLVQGGGAIGLGSALALRALGAEDVTIVEPNPLRHPALKREGFAVAEPDALEGPFQLILDAVGVEASRRAASALAEPGGAIIHIGLGGGAPGLDVRRITLQEIAFIGSYCYTMDDFRQAVDRIFSGSFGDLQWFEERPLSEGGRAFEEIDAGKVAAPKIILRP